MTTPNPHDGPAPQTPPPADAGEAQPAAESAAPAPDRAEHTVMLSRSSEATPQPAPQQPPGDGTVLLAAQAPPVQQPQAAPTGAPPQPYAAAPHPQAPAAPPAAPAAPPAAPPAQAGAWPPPQAMPGIAPMRRTHLGHALASEWTKIRTVRSTMWTLGVMFVLVVGIGFLTALAISDTGPQYITTPLLGGGLFGLMLGQICVITLGVLVITSEYGTGMIRTTMTACPTRGRVLLAKAIVFFLVAFVMTSLAAAVTALLQVGILGDRQLAEGGRVPEGMADSVVGGEQIATGGEWFDATVGVGLYIALLGLLSLSVGALLRHSAGAITAMLGVVLLPMLIAIFLPAGLHTLQEALLEYSPLNGLAAMFHMPFQGEVGSSGWPLLGLLAAVTGAMLACAYAAPAKRDV
jgi:hypothetical protein